MRADDANAIALSRVHAVCPQWRGVVAARDAVGLPDFTLLHAGPPFDDPRKPSAPVRSSAILCCLYEGWANDEAHAERLIEQGEVRLECAQSYGVVTPLAAVVSPRTTLVEVTDASDPAARAWSLLGSGAGPQIRFGSRDMRILERMQWRDSVLASVLDEALAHGPLDLLALAQAGLDDGDDLHARTTGATAALRAQLASRLDHADIDAMLARTPLFFLTPWMAACALMLSAAARAGQSKSTLVVALAGNGERVGIRLAGAPSRWITADARAPEGPRIDPQQQAAAAPLTGDSGVIDAAGFGAQALAFAPEPAQAFEAYLPAGWRDRQARIHTESHPAFGRLPGVLDAARVVQEGVAPLAAIAMIGADGRAGLLGRGLYTAPPELFAHALSNLSGEAA
ncbi:MULTISPECIES: DUF1116 domain-containing protein [Paraburkholderia]|uniref:DUF1116 domain-containing protein n=1 Tax=Paraburkholderia hospita TaxID=169430 RepID=A0AAN1J6E0_9BURK|nr:DUF1116 domain-containing protein [Paraburkholderia hospita]AUT68339.1 DUF1116 domain-containing protein [Paraburkholderia hospita]SEI27339.1 Protein of unknown function [Paraburkholderia hospita]